MDTLFEVQSFASLLVLRRVRCRGEIDVHWRGWGNVAGTDAIGRWFDLLCLLFSHFALASILVVLHCTSLTIAHDLYDFVHGQPLFPPDAAGVVVSRIGNGQCLQALQLDFETLYVPFAGHPDFDNSSEGLIFARCLGIGIRRVDEDVLGQQVQGDFAWLMDDGGQHRY